MKDQKFFIPILLAGLLSCAPANASLDEADEATIYTAVPGDLQFRVTGEGQALRIGTNAEGYKERLQRRPEELFTDNQIECALFGVADVCVPRCPSRFDEAVIDNGAIVSVVQKGSQERPWIFFTTLSRDEAVPYNDREGDFAVWSQEDGVIAFGSSDPSITRTTTFYILTEGRGIFRHGADCPS